MISNDYTTDGEKVPGDGDRRNQPRVFPYLQVQDNVRYCSDYPGSVQHEQPQVKYRMIGFYWKVKDSGYYDGTVSEDHREYEADKKAVNQNIISECMTSKQGQKNTT